MTGDGESDRPAEGTTTPADSWLRDAVAAPACSPGGPEPRLAAGDLIAERYRLEKPLGQGGMGVVWAARHVVTRKPVALKFVKHANRERPETRQRFLREARAACAVRHPSVVAVHDVLELEDGSPVMVMDLLVGESMAQRLERERALPLSEVARLMVPVCAGVGSAHALGIVHRDLKPDNIFLCDEVDGTAGVKVLDFGIAKLTATEGDAAHTGASTNTGVLLGTPYYMAPEQMFAEKNIDHRADLWAIGVILYEALSGKRPTQAENVGQILKVIARDKIVPLRRLAPSVPEPVLDLVGRLLEVEPEQRPSDLREVVDVLSKYTSAQAEPFGAPRAASSSNVRPPRRWTLPAVMAGLAIAGAGAVAIGIFGRSSAVRPAQAVPASSVMAAPASAPTLASATPSALVPTPAAVESAAVAPVETATTMRPPVPRVRPSTTANAPALASAAPAPSPAPSSMPAPRPPAATPKMSDDL
ncbi:MAG TPA: protein kinase [Polyangiaceae bacterium]